MRIYVASSWRNERQQAFVEALRADGHLVYDFRNPPAGRGGFHWSDLDPAWREWSAEGYRETLLTHPLAANGYLNDLRAMIWADACVLVMPCGRSAHLELGWCAGAGKRTVILLADGEPELMYLLANHIVTTTEELLRTLVPIFHESGRAPAPAWLP
jgi:hypothetical protein